MLLLIDKVSLKIENNSVIEIIYCVEKSIVHKSEIYNLKVKVLNSLDKEDCVFIENFTNSKKIAKDIFNKLVEFSVTPTSLINVIDDYFYKM